MTTEASAFDVLQIGRWGGDKVLQFTGPTKLELAEALLCIARAEYRRAWKDHDWAWRRAEGSWSVSEQRTLRAKLPPLERRRDAARERLLGEQRAVANALEELHEVAVKDAEEKALKRAMGSVVDGAIARHNDANARRSIGLRPRDEDWENVDA